MDYQLVIVVAMKRNKILININSLDEIGYYKEIGISNFLFAVRDFSIGYKDFPLSDIPDNSYLLMNRLLDTNDILNLKNNRMYFTRFKGIIYEDAGVLNIFKDTNLELITFQNHFCTNHKTINFFTNHGATSAVISNEITSQEIKSIIEQVNKPLVFTILAKNQIMYSRRSLLTNFNKQYNIDNQENVIIKENISKNSFKVVESDKGTVLFNDEYFNYIDYAKTLDDKKVLYYLILNLDLDKYLIKEILENKEFGNHGFLDKKTVVKMKDYI